MVGNIESRDNPKIKYAIKAADDRTFRRKEGVFFASTSKVVSDMLDFGFEHRMIFVCCDVWEKHKDAMPKENVFIISRRVRDKLSEGKTEDGVYGVFCRRSIQPEKVLESEKLLVLQDVQDPGNMGAIMRTALAFGFENAVVTPGCADVYSRKVIRSSMTASVKMNVIRVDDLASFTADLGERGFCTVASCLEDAGELGEEKISRPVALYIGSEGQGLGRDVIAACKKRVKIPMSEKIESLNAAVSAAILMWELR